MAELTIRPEEIRDALDRFVQDYTPDTSSREEVGTVVTSGDGIARVEGLPSAMANELLEFENGTLGIALNLDVREIGVVVMGDSGGHRGGPGRQADRGHPLRAGGRRLPRPDGRRPGQPDRRPRRPHRRRRSASAGAAGGRRDGPPGGPAAAADRDQGHRRDDPDRPRSAAADHRRPQDRQDRHRDRHDHEPEGGLGVRRRGTAGALHLRRHRPEGLDHRRDPRPARGGRCAAVHDHRALAGLRPGRLQVRRALHRVGHRPALDVPGQARADRLRRPDQAGRGLPCDVAAAAPAARS